MARSADGGFTWSPFRQLAIDGLEVDVDNNIYYFTPQPFNETHLVAHFPAVLRDGRSGVFATLSRDGVRWGAPRMLLRASSYEERTELHPIGLRGDALELMHINLYNLKSPGAGRAWVRVGIGGSPKGHSVGLYSVPVAGA
eukprot:1174061-Prymnesium_polylepis.1